MQLALITTFGQVATIYFSYTALNITDNRILEITRLVTGNIMKYLYISFLIEIFIISHF